jgi:DNA gyrase subunit B
MPQIIERGYLYIAQPPLFKYKKGKTEKYLKDDKELFDFLSDAGMNSLELIDKEGNIFDKTGMMALMAKLNRYDDLLRLASRRRAKKVVEFFVERANVSVADFGTEESVNSLKDKVIEYIKSSEPSNTGYCVADVVFDEEHSRYRLEVKTRIDNKPMTTVVDSAFVGSGEFTELKRLSNQMQEVAKLPFNYTRTKGGKSGNDGDIDKNSGAIESLNQLKTFVVEEGRRGAYVQRYKGLGEMNPDQLQETTMLQDRRTLLQIEVEDAIEADRIFSTLMGDDVEPRRDFIQTNALNVRNLDA